MSGEGIQIFPSRMKLAGLFNVYNTLAAIACGYALGISPEEIKEWSSEKKKVTGVAGRFELLDEGTGFYIYCGLCPYTGWDGKCI